MMRFLLAIIMIAATATVVLADVTFVEATKTTVTSEPARLDNVTLVSTPHGTAFPTSQVGQKPKVRDRIVTQPELRPIATFVDAIPSTATRSLARTIASTQQMSNNASGCSGEQKSGVIRQSHDPETGEITSVLMQLTATTGDAFNDGDAVFMNGTVVTTGPTDGSWEMTTWADSKYRGNGSVGISAKLDYVQPERGFWYQAVARGSYEGDLDDASGNFRYFYGRDLTEKEGANYASYFRQACDEIEMSHGIFNNAPVYSYDADSADKVTSAAADIWDEEELIPVLARIPGVVRFLEPYDGQRGANAILSAQLTRGEVAKHSAYAHIRELQGGNGKTSRVIINGKTRAEKFLAGKEFTYELLITVMRSLAKGTQSAVNETQWQMDQWGAYAGSYRIHRAKVHGGVFLPISQLVDLRDTDLWTHNGGPVDFPEDVGKSLDSLQEQMRFYRPAWLSYEAKVLANGTLNVQYAEYIRKLMPPPSPPREDGEKGKQ